MRDPVCLNCIHFTSYKEIYEDDQEPDDFGICSNRNIQEENINREFTCDEFEGGEK